MQQLHGEKTHVKKPATNGTKRRSPASAPVDREEMIRQTAYSFYEARGFVSGFELEDWLKAEAQVLPAPSPSATAATEEPTSH